jgi:hypothetical protein
VTLKNSDQLGLHWPRRPGKQGQSDPACRSCASCWAKQHRTCTSISGGHVDANFIAIQRMIFQNMLEVVPRSVSFRMMGAKIVKSSIHWAYRSEPANKQGGGDSRLPDGNDSNNDNIAPISIALTCLFAAWRAWFMSPWYRKNSIAHFHMSNGAFIGFTLPYPCRTCPDSSSMALDVNLSSSRPSCDKCIVPTLALSLVWYVTDFASGSKILIEWNLWRDRPDIF